MGTEPPNECRDTFERWSLNQGWEISGPEARMRWATWQGAWNAVAHPIPDRDELIEKLYELKLQGYCGPTRNVTINDCIAIVRQHQAETLQSEGQKFTINPTTATQNPIENDIKPVIEVKEIPGVSLVGFPSEMRMTKEEWADNILAEFKNEGNRTKVEEWAAAYAMLFKQLSTLSELASSEIQVVLDKIFGAISNAQNRGGGRGRQAKEVLEAIRPYLRTTEPDKCLDCGADMMEVCSGLEAAAKHSEHVQLDSKLNISSEIPLQPPVDNKFVKEGCELFDMVDEKHIRDLMVEAAKRIPLDMQYKTSAQIDAMLAAIRPYLRTTEPASVSLEKCALEIAKHQGVSFREQAKAVLEAVGVKYDS